MKWFAPIVILSRIGEMEERVTPDVFSKEKRSEIMARIRSKDTRWEIAFRRKLHRRGLRYRLYYGPYKIDIAFPKARIAVFLDSCWWHYCPTHREIPKTNAEFWLRKFERTSIRDRRVTRTLRNAGWTVLRLWSHDYVPRPDAAATKVERRVRQRKA